MVRKKRGGSLTRQQRSRIAVTQKKRSDRLAVRGAADSSLPDAMVLGDAEVSLLDTVDLGEEEEGVVTAHFGFNVEVKDGTGERFRCAVRKSLLEEPVCGDRVRWMRAGEGQGVISGIQQRFSVLQRPLSYRRVQTIAANVDQVFIVTVAHDPHFGLLDRYLVAAGAAGIQAVLVVNKIDLVDDPAGVKASFAHYERMGYGVLFTSTVSLEGLSELLEALAGRVSVLVGQSGTGKSSLAAQWISESSLRIGAVNQLTGQGRHTTTVASLYALPKGGHLIDSPGIRAFGLHGVAPEEVGRYFVEIAPFLGTCRFSDCQHAQEPHCVVQRAVQSGEIHPDRLESLRQIQVSLREEKLF